MNHPVVKHDELVRWDPVRSTLGNDAETQAVALEQVIAAVSGARKMRLVMLDACRDNPFETSMRRTMAVKLVNKGLSNIEPEAGFMVVYAAKHGETALDGDSVNSPFATALAREIRAPKVEVRKMFDIVRDVVWTATKHTQQPFTYGSLSGRQKFYFTAGKLIAINISILRCPAAPRRARPHRGGAGRTRSAAATA